MKANKNTQAVVRAEGHNELAPVKRTLDIAGLDEVPTNMIPVPFYKLVQPGSTNITLATGEDALPGTIYMKDSGQSVETLRFALLRAKRQQKEFTNDEGDLVHSVTMGILGVNLDGFNPFILNVPVSSFGSFGQLLKQLKDKKVMKAWEYPIVVSTTKREEMKVVKGKPQKVKYWVFTFSVEKERLDDVGIQMLDDAYTEFAASLDRQNEEEAAKATPPAISGEVVEPEEAATGKVPVTMEGNDTPF